MKYHVVAEGNFICDFYEYDKIIDCIDQLATKYFIFQFCLYESPIQFNLC